jgi:hypothetical protein
MQLAVKLAVGRRLAAARMDETTLVLSFSYPSCAAGEREPASVPRLVMRLVCMNL